MDTNAVQAGAAVLKPMMLAAVDLDQFPNACPSHAWLLDLRRPQLPWNPKPDSNLQSPYGLLRQIDAVLGSELLGSQCWSKIRVR
jgi:hypothetical protein